jgi:hypothetical protein
MRSIDVNFEIVGGPNALQVGLDPNGPADFTVPDLHCTVQAGEQICTTLTYKDARSPQGGTQDTIVAWIDHDSTEGVSLEGIDMTEQADAGRDKGAPGGSAGGTPEEDTTDAVTKDWGQLQVSDDPFTDGRVELFQLACDSARRRVDGSVVGVVRVCSYMVAMDPSQEQDAASDFAAVWVQATGRATARGWCATRLSVTAKVPRAGQQVASGSFPDTDLGARRVLTSALTFDAAGTATEAAWVEASAFVYPRRVRTATETNRTTTTWRGAGKKLIAIPVGVAFSYPAAGGLPNPADPSDVALRVERRRC